MEEIRAVVLDLDGTLLNIRGHISNENMVYLKKLSKKGIKIYIATGRGADAFGIIKDIPCDGIVLNNGLQAYYGNRLVWKKQLEKRELIYFWDSMKDMGIEIGTYIEEGLCKSIMNREGISSSYQLCDEIPECFAKMFVKINKSVNIEMIKERVPDGYYIIFSRDGYGFILPDGISKYSSLKKIIEFDGIHMEQIIAFGDDQSDKELIEKCGIGVAMGNALKDVKNIAKFVTKSNERNGIIYMLEHLEAGGIIKAID